MATDVHSGIITEGLGTNHLMTEGYLATGIFGGLVKMYFAIKKTIKHDFTVEETIKHSFTIEGV